MGTPSGADGSSDTTKRLLAESRELLDSLTERLGDEVGAVVVDPEEPGEDDAERG